MTTESEIPILDLRRSSGVNLEEGSDGRKEMGNKVREAFETHGCFLIRCDEIPKELRAGLFGNIKSLFDLPEETKKKLYNPKPYRGYTSKSRVIPHSESFGIDNSPKADTTLEEFTNLMWPEGNPTFCEELRSMTSKARELSVLILKMLVESLGLPEQYKLDVEDLNNYNDTRVTRYQLPPDTKETEIALTLHTDKGTLALICENDVQGLQVLSKTGNYVDVKIPYDGFVVIVGDILKAWSNGRFQAAPHRVVTKGDKERLVFVLFSVPKQNMLIKGPSEFVDDDHPLRYRSFHYDEFVDYHYTTSTEESVLEKFAGI
ncbi:probable 2-oxoglutarate-dependent dioxygenase AOP1 [Cicer arietinum]|uniref:2-oxoglutarate-dependent dioxygenase DAO n=1 Tax=Cicer arietinum TaxID=3827 RepID=A0A1S2YH71_CICAR|nr:probable inactive 2-oxoglutarate-dependent dioxygenase AOP2 [Cicer arietinum]